MEETSKKGLDLTLPFRRQNSHGHHERKNKVTMISSTALAIIMGVHIYGSPQQLYRLIKGLEQKKDFSSRATEHGNKSEPLAAETLLHFLNLLYGVVLFYTTGTAQYWAIPGLIIGSPDRIYWNPVTLRWEGAELKCPFSKKIPKNLEDKEGWEQLAPYSLQCYGCMGIYNIVLWNLFFFDPRTLESSWFQIHFDKELWDEIVVKCQKFVKLTQQPKVSKGKQKKIEALIPRLGIKHIQYIPPSTKKEKEEETYVC